jgi:cell wall-associated NlpC family hydrolase
MRLRRKVIVRRKVIAGWGSLLLVAALSGCGGSGTGTAGHSSKTSAKSDPPAAKSDSAVAKTSAQTVKTASVKTPNGRRVEVAEVRDPEEAKSFPLPASTQHRSASSPSVAGAAAVAAGAPSDAEIKRELNEMHAVERAAAQTQRQELTPVAGGESVGGNGTIPIPSGVPEAVQRVIAGGNAIADFPYIWGGGHASFIANGYDCSGSVSYALAAGGLLSAPLVSGELANWGEPGPGRWITIYANAGHTFMDVDGMWFDTAGRSGPYASRWLVATPPLEGYAVRHPQGL